MGMVDGQELYNLYLFAGNFFYVVFFLLGLALGSFLNSWIWRRWENIRISTGRSICNHCHRQLRWYENIPVFSYIFLKGKCRTCHKTIPWYYAAVELSTAFLLTFIFWHHAEHWQLTERWQWFLMRNVFFAVFLIVIFVFDALYQIILPRVVWVGSFIGLVLNYYLGCHSVSSMALGALIAGGFFLLQFAVSKGKWIGGGDVRLGVMMGIWLGWQHVLVALFLAYILGALFAIILLLLKKKNLRSTVPFGSFLAFSALISIYYADNIINWYLHLMK